jgi:hypothetical protein
MGLTIPTPEKINITKRSGRRKEYKTHRGLYGQRRRKNEKEYRSSLAL